MRYRVSLLLLFGLVGLEARGEERSPMHPPIPLLDVDGTNVLESGKPVSTMTTCADCHDTEYIEQHSFHADLGSSERTGVGFVEGGRPWDYSPGPFGQWDPLGYRYLTPPGDNRLDLGVADWIRLFGARHVGGGPARLGHAGSALTARADALGKVDPDTMVLDPQTGLPKPWDWQASGAVEMNCFLCHMDQPDNEARVAELAAGRFAWSDTATLAATGIARQEDGTWHYNLESFTNGGLVEAAVLGLGDPKSKNCGLCHGQVHAGHEPVTLELSFSARSTATTGRVFSGQRLSDSGVNLVDKERLGRPWDVHAERLVECTDCHFSLNNPAFSTSSMAGGPGHMHFDPRRSSPGEYLLRPSHQLAKGTTAQGSTAGHLSGTMRVCQDCHHADASHEWLPYQEAHFAALSCEACHIPHVAAPALETVDWTVPSAEGEPVVTWRGMDGAVDDPRALVSGFKPVMMPRKQPDGDRPRLVPCNLITVSYWVDNDQVPRPVRLPDLAKVVNGGAEDLDAVRAGLVEQGYKAPEIRSEVQPYEIHHGVVGSRWSTRDCDACHSAGSVLTAPMTIAADLPGDSPPAWAHTGALITNGKWVAGSDATVYEPDTLGAGYYVLGHDGYRWIDVFGTLSLIGVLTGVIVHGSLRIRYALANREPAVSEEAVAEQESGEEKRS